MRGGSARPSDDNDGELEAARPMKAPRSAAYRHGALGCLHPAGGAALRDGATHMLAVARCDRHAPIGPLPQFAHSFHQSATPDGLLPALKLPALKRGGCTLKRDG